MPVPSLFSSAIFIAITLAVAGVFWVGTGRSLRVLGALVFWLAFTYILAARGMLASFTPPPPMFGVLAIGLIAAVALTLSPIGKRLALASSAAWLIGFQVFRVPVEIGLFRLHQDGVVPAQMTFEGVNFDILTGLTAIPVAWLASRNRLPSWGLLIWNVFGLALLVNILAVAILSMPLPIRVFFNEPANTIVTAAPFIWLPAFLVPAALAGHLLVFRRLLQSHSAAVQSPRPVEAHAS